VSKRFLIGAIITVLVAVSLGTWLIYWERKSANSLHVTITQADIRESAVKLGRTNLPTQSVVTPLDLSQPVRLAIGGLGLADEDQNRQLGELITADLTGAQGFNLVERQSLDAILKEINLNLSGLVRANDAVRVGKLLKADWFVLGTRAKINGTNSIVVRVVDARTGIFQDAGAFPADQSPTQLAADMAGFVRQSRQNAATAKPRVYLAIGAFEDLSVNNRQASFPSQLRGYLTTAYRGGNVTLLEREYVNTLLQEMRLDLAGLTGEGGTNAPQPMQTAFWLVDGYYQSYETTNLQVELTLNVQRIFGTAKHVTLRGQPGEPVCRQIKAAIDEIMNRNKEVNFPTRMSEVHAQMATGKELMRINPVFASIALVYVPEVSSYDQVENAKRKRNLEEAIKAFETVLVLEPTNREAKMYLAACLRYSVIDQPDDARNYYREIIEEPIQDQWSGQAQKALLVSFEFGGRTNPDEMARWFESASQQVTNSPVADFYRKQAEIAETAATIARGESPKAKDLAEQKLLEGIRSFDRVLHGGTGALGSGMVDFVKTFGTNQTAAAQRLVELLPQMTNQAPELEPYLLAEVVTFQVDTNAPVIAEFQKRFAQVNEHANEEFTNGQSSASYWSLLGNGVYDWSFQHKQYGLAAQVMEGKLKAAAAEGNISLNVQNGEDRIALAYAYLGMERWQQALAVFESFSNQPVAMLGNGPWGRGLNPVLTGKEAAYCRQKLGLPAGHSPLEFDMGKPLLCLCTPSTFITDDSGLWVGIGGQLLHLDFDLKTNLVVNLPVDASVPITALCLTSSNVWIATGGDGLVEFDKASRQCRHLTEKDGLMMDKISSLHLDGNTLWIGYGHNTFYTIAVGQTEPGGLGKLDLPTGRFTSFTPSLSDTEKVNAEKPTRITVMAMNAGAGGDLWFITADSVPLLYRFQPRNNLWDGSRRACTALVGNSKQLIVSQYGSPALSILDFGEGRWRNLKATTEFLSGMVSTLTLDGDNLWVGGMGYIALMDPMQDKVRRFAYIPASTVDRIQIGGGYVWAQFDWHLYRALLSDVR
jgi:tetratricopeptide (TPR) repeat protein